MAKDVVQLVIPEARRRPPPPPQIPDPGRLNASIRTPVRLGWAVILTFAVGFGSWATTVPLASGAIAPGIVSPDGSRRTVQHLEGGIISEIKAFDGDYVEKGQPVMTLENVQANSAYGDLQQQYRSLLAIRARLTAELFGHDTITFPPELMTLQNSEISDIMESQRAIFKSRRDFIDAQKAVLRERLQQSDEQINALKAQIVSAETQISLLGEEIVTKQKLVDDALVTKPQLLALQRQEAELQGRRDEFKATIAEIGQKRGEIESQLLSLDAEQTDKITAEMDDTRTKLASLSERMTASLDILDRTIVRAPVSGRVVNSRFKTEGGVVVRGEPIMDIVPTAERLLIDARVNIVDIDIVHPGLPAAIRLTALDYYRMPRVEGVVDSVSADRITDPTTGQSYYLARVEVPRDTLADQAANDALVPGMPAEVLIVTGQRTMLEYLLEPFQAAFRRAFRET